MNKSDTLIVNLLGGPGSGKSTTAANVFSELKWSDVNCEIAAEYAKDLVWEHRFKTFENQIYIFGKQHHRIYRLIGQVEVVITDSPILLTPIYDLEKRETLKQLVLEEYNKVNNFNVVLTRRKKYNPKGRNQTEDGAKGVDVAIREFLQENDLPYLEVPGNPQSVIEIVQEIKRIKGIT